MKQRAAIKSLIDEANEEGFPQGVEEREAYFNEQVMTGEMLSQDREFVYFAHGGTRH
jgi:mitochondrial import receptor subunit TOM20